MRERIREGLGQSPFLRELYGTLDESNLVQLRDLNRFPVLDRSAVAEWISRDGIDKKGLIPLRTGGTSGAPVTTYVTRNHLDWSRAAILRFHAWIGYKVGDRQGRLFAAPTRTGIPETGYRVRFRNWLANAIFLDALDLSDSAMDRLIDSLRRFRPRLLMGYTSCLAAIAGRLQERGETLGVDRMCIVNAAEPLDAPRRALIEAAFSCPMFDHYGTREFGPIADECPERKGLHVHMEHVLVEVVSEGGQWLEPGTEGELLLTQLNNGGMPLVRYRIGDRGVIDPDPCPCGRSLVRLARVTGRVTDFLRLPDGRRLTGLVIPHTLKDFPIVEYQVRQTSTRRVEADLVIRDGSEGCLAGVKQALSGVMPGIEVTVNLVKRVPRSPSGKLKSVISLLGEGAGHRSRS